MTMSTKHFYGWIPDKPDQRDLIFGSVVVPTRLPASVDLRAQMPPVYNQGQLGSCTANAVAAALDYQRRQQHELLITPSRLFIYYNERLIEGTVASDAGASIRDSVKSVVKYGAPKEADYTYSAKRFAAKPPPRAYTKAVQFEALTYASVPQSISSLKTALAQNHPVIAGITVYDSFESADTAKTGDIPLPNPSEGVLGGHAILVVGYEDAALGNMWICRNSWGAAWGDKGYFYLPQKYLTDPKLSSDFWVLDTVK